MERAKGAVCDGLETSKIMWHTHPAVELAEEGNVGLWIANGKSGMVKIDGGNNWSVPGRGFGFTSLQSRLDNSESDMKLDSSLTLWWF